MKKAMKHYEEGMPRMTLSQQVCNFLFILSFPLSLSLIYFFRFSLSVLL